MNRENLNEEQQEKLLFMMLIQQHQQIAMMGMGKIQNPATEQIEKDLSSAKYAIDTLGMLKKYTKGNLSEEANNYLDQTLTNLRLNYAEESKKEKAESSEEETDSDE
ncbi:DUF1844 domain-containing protein [Gracilimonas sp.]|uniref:DUF1844 domain-containing protein n=1 Tax=Gracilimonas sp. TaxID=1974203 RepID=UPI0028723598|nr:DUF1844 domain-containing protein [Gracilimonas sp.]